MRQLWPRLSGRYRPRAPSGLVDRLRLRLLAAVLRRREGEYRPSDFRLGPRAPAKPPHDLHVAEAEARQRSAFIRQSYGILPPGIPLWPRWLWQRMPSGLSLLAPAGLANGTVTALGCFRYLAKTLAPLLFWEAYQWATKRPNLLAAGTPRSRRGSRRRTLRARREAMRTPKRRSGTTKISRMRRARSQVTPKRDKRTAERLPKSSVSVALTSKIIAAALFHPSKAPILPYGSFGRCEELPHDPATAANPAILSHQRVAPK